MKLPDIDIDLGHRSAILEIIPHVIAMRDNNALHPSGIYIQPIPSNPITNQSTIPYKIASQRGYFKVDLLNVSIYEHVKNEQHLITLMNTTPPWDLLLEQPFSDMIFHLNGHSAILQRMKPSSIPELAAVLAMIRPSKKYLVGKPWPTIFKEVWLPPPNNSFHFKKAHGISYAVATTVHMNIVYSQLLTMLDAETTESTAASPASPLNCPNSSSAPSLPSHPCY